MKKNLLKGYIAIIYGMFLLFVLINSFQAKTVDKWSFFYMFTQQSNILVLLWLVFYGINVFNPKKFNFVKNKIVMIAVTVYISITFFIVAFVLTPIFSGSFNPLESTSELFLHHLTPVVMWIYFFIVKAKGDVSIKKIPFVLIYPFIFVIVNLFVGAFVTYSDGVKAYAYAFINPNTYGNIFIYIIVILVLLAIFTTFSVLLTKFKTYIDKIEDKA